MTVERLLLYRKKIIVVGAGVGGLSTAIRLQSKGYQVEIFEKESMVGGKMHQIQGNGFTFDLGPTMSNLINNYPYI